MEATGATPHSARSACRITSPHDPKAGIASSILANLRPIGHYRQFGQRQPLAVVARPVPNSTRRRPFASDVGRHYQSPSLIHETLHAHSAGYARTGIPSPLCCGDLNPRASCRATPGKLQNQQLPGVPIDAPIPTDFITDPPGYANSLALHGRRWPSRGH
jgi:hypothetical protein